MPSVLIQNIGCLVSGDVNAPLIEADSLYIEDGLFKAVGTSRNKADLVIDARKNTVAPGLSIPTYT